MEALKKHNIPVKFELFKGAFHGFDMLLMKTAIAQKAIKFQFDAFAKYYDEYILQKPNNL